MSGTLGGSALPADSDDDLKNLLNLKLKKPKHWNWELTTSKSSSSINFPRIRLYDHRNNLLAEADESEQLVNNTTSTQPHPTRKHPHRKKAESFANHDQPAHVLAAGRRSKSRSKTMDMSSFLDDIRSEMLGQGFECKVRQRSSCERGRSGSRVRNCSEAGPGSEDIREEEHVQVTLPRPPPARSPLASNSSTTNVNHISNSNVELSKRHQRDRQGMRQVQRTCSDVGAIKDRVSARNLLVNNEKHLSANVMTNGVSPAHGHYSITKSKSALDVPGGRATGCLGGGAAGKKKVYRRTHSTNSSLRFSSSILERFSETKRRSSSTDSEAGPIIEEATSARPANGAGDEIGYKAPNYILRTCPAGTIMVCKDSFHSKCGRRRNASAPRRHTQEPVSTTSFTENHSTPGNSTSYDTAIANIDTLICRAISGTSMAPSTEAPPTTSNPSNKNNAPGSAPQHKVVQLPAAAVRTGSIRDKLTPRSRSVSAVAPEENNVGDVSAAVDGNGHVETETVRRRRGRKKSDWEQVQRHRLSAMAADNCTRKMEVVRGRRRSASAGSARIRVAGGMTMSSSSDDDEMQQTAVIRPTANRRGRERMRRSKVTSDLQTTGAPTSRDIPQQADPQRSLKHSLSLTGLETNNDHLFKSPNDKKVLLELVQRLASLQQHQQQPQQQFPLPAPTLDRPPHTKSSHSHTELPPEIAHHHHHYNQPIKYSCCADIRAPGQLHNVSHTDLINGSAPGTLPRHPLQVTHDPIHKKCAPTSDDCDCARKCNQCNTDRKTTSGPACIRHQHGTTEHHADSLRVSGDHKRKSCRQQTLGAGEERDELDDEEPAFTATMGSNVSRHSGKGLSGRRTQSSGDLCSDPKHHPQSTGLDARNHPNGASFCATKHKRRVVTQANGKSGAGAATGIGQQSANGGTTIGTTDKAAIYGHINVAGVAEVDAAAAAASGASPALMMTPGGRVSRTDRNKFSGSLPNHLDVGPDGQMDDGGGVVEGQTSMAEGVRIAHHHNNNNIEYVTVGQYLPHHHHHHHQQQHAGGQTGYTTYPVGNLQQQQQQPPPPQEQSPYNNSSSEKGSTSSSSNLGSTFRSNNDCHKPEVQLRLPINRVAFDPGCDQGYGSERSPEDELPPPLPNLLMVYPPEAAALGLCGPMKPPTVAGYEFSFITPDCCFPVQVTKGPGGLGLSVSGGSDSNAAFPGLIRIKRLFPHQVAWSTGMLQQGDILLAANDIPLTGLTNCEALEVLRTVPDIVNLTVCRPRDEQYRKLSPPAEAPKPPQRNQPSTLPLYPIQMNFCGEFEIIMVKQQGSLGFTLRKEDESVLGHCVRALVREPATTDGRIQPGDKIVAVNDVEMCNMSHEEAVIFLRMAAETVKLRLYREEIQTPVALTHEDSLAMVKNKTILRPEAITLLNEMAYRNKKNHNTSTDTDHSGSSMRSTNTLRKLKRNGGNKSGGGGGGGCGTATSTSDEGEKTDSRSFTYPNYIVTSQPTSVCSDSEASITSQCSFVVQPADPHGHNSTYAIEENDGDFYEEDELWKLEDGEEAPYRPAHLELAGKSGSTPVSSRKPRFQFTVAANAYELNNLDNDALDAPIFTLVAGAGDGSSGHQHHPNINGAALDRASTQSDFASLPCETFLVACKTNESNEADRWAHVADAFAGRHQPMYQSAHAHATGTGATAATTTSARMMDDEVGGVDCVDGAGRVGGTTSLLKWKGVMFASDDEAEEDAHQRKASTGSRAGKNVVFVIDADRNGAELGGGSERRSGDDSDSSRAEGASNVAPEGRRNTPGPDGFDLSAFATDGHKVYNVELHRGWNSRLGFSLQTYTSADGAAAGGTVISAIYSDSVAAKDGRLKVGDQVLMVNDEPVVRMTTAEVIDLLRIIRGSIVLTIRRNVTA